MKNKRPLLVLSFVSALLLSGCSLILNELLPNSSLQESEVSSTAEASSIPSESTPAVSHSETVEGYTVYHSENDRLGIHPNANTFFGGPCLDSIGNKKILVVPVYTSDATTFSSAEIATIEKAYNGQASETGWHSLSSYYEASSYGKLHLHADVVTPFAVGMSTSALAEKYYSDTSDYSFDDFVNLIVADAAKKVTLTDYDLDGDGYIDSLQIIYKNNGTSWTGEEDDTKMWWNFTNVTDNYPNRSAPTGGCYFWSQMSMIQTGFYSPNIDCHTLIHEMGHMLGIDDYYSYSAKTDGDPAGMIDMMDMNVGDHCAASKLLLGWVDPFVPDGYEDTFDLTLRPFESSGDCLMIVDPLSWNGSAYDEYFLVEYYTPTGVNYLDATKGYKEWEYYGDHGRIYQKAGLKVFHVDHRLGYLDQDSRGNILFRGFTDSHEKGTHAISTIVSSNTSDYSYSEYRKLEMIPATGTNYFIGSTDASRYGSQACLYSTLKYGGGSTKFNATTCAQILEKGRKMNDGTAIPYGFSIKAQSDSEITLTVTKL